METIISLGVLICTCHQRRSALTNQKWASFSFDVVLFDILTFEQNIKKFISQVNQILLLWCVTSLFLPVASRCSSAALAVALNICSVGLKFDYFLSGFDMWRTKSTYMHEDQSVKEKLYQRGVTNLWLVLWYKNNSWEFSLTENSQTLRASNITNEISFDSVNMFESLKMFSFQKLKILSFIF